MTKPIAKRLTPAISTIKALLAKSSNLCAFPDCSNQLFNEDGEFIAQLCHIEAAETGGQRFNPKQTDEERRHFDNLIYFCYEHHVVTNNVEEFQVDRLKEIKNVHEARCSKKKRVKEKDLEAAYAAVHNQINIISRKTEIIEIKVDKIIESNNAFLNGLNRHFLDQIDWSKELRDNDNPQQALFFLLKLKNDKWDNLSSREKYRVLANIGICYLEMFNEEQAGIHFVQAYQYDPEEENTISFAALGYSLLNKKEKACELIDKTLSKNPYNVNAYIAKICLERDSKNSFNSILDSIPKIVKQSPEVSFSLGILAKRKGEMEQAILFLQNAQESFKINKAQINASLGSTILESLIDPDKVIFKQLTTEELLKIENALRIINDSWEVLKEKEIRKSYVNLLTNKAIAKRILNDLDGALQDLIFANEITPNGLNILTNLCIIYNLKSNYISALDIISKIKLYYPDSTDADLMQTEILIKLERYEEANDLINKIIKHSELESILREEASILQTHCLLQLNRLKEAEELAFQNISSHPNQFAYFYCTLTIYNSSDSKDNILSLINKIEDKFNIRDLSLRFQYLYSKILINIGKLNDAVLILERITSDKTDSDLSRTLIEVYYEIGEKQKALNLCRSICTYQQTNGFLSHYQRIIFEEIGDLDNAIKICNDLLILEPSNDIIKIRLAELLIKHNDKESATRILLSISNYGDLPLEHRFVLANLYIYLEDIEKALDTSYEARRDFYNNQDAHLYYLDLYCRNIGYIEKLEIPNVVKLGFAIQAESVNGNIHTYIIENRNPCKIELNEISLSSTIYKEIGGKKIGEEVILNKALNQKSILKIINIQSKYIYAFHDTLNILSSKFIDSDQVLIWDLPKDRGNAFLDESNPIIQNLKENESFDQLLYDIYKSGNISIGTFSEIKRQNPIKSWSEIASVDELGIFSVGQFHEDNQNFEGNHEKNIVIDIIPLISLFEINSLDILELLPNKKIISQSTYNHIIDIYTELNSQNVDMYRLVKRNKKVFKDVLKKEHANNLALKFKELIDWCRNNLSILPCNYALSMNSKIKEENDKVLGKCSFESILLAKETESIFFSDESNLRSLILNEYNLYGFSTINLIEYMRNYGYINEHRYNSIITDLHFINYKNLPLSSKILYEIFFRSGFKPSHPVSIALKTISDSSINSAIQVIVEFLYEIYSINNLKLLRINLSILILNSIFCGRDKESKNISNRLIKVINIKFYLLQPQKDELLEILNIFMTSKSKTLF